MSIDVLGKIQQYLPLLIPIVLLQLGLMVTALIDIGKRVKTKGPKWVWILIVIFINLIGPIVYFLIGRDE